MNWVQDCHWTSSNPESTIITLLDQPKVLYSLRSSGAMFMFNTGPPYFYVPYRVASFCATYSVREVAFWQGWDLSSFLILVSEQRSPSLYSFSSIFKLINEAISLLPGAYLIQFHWLFGCIRLNQFIWCFWLLINDIYYFLFITWFCI